MSKYYREEDVIRAIAEQLCWIARTEYGDKFTTEDWLEEAEDYVSDLPIIEVSEDCISREDAVNALMSYFIPQTYTGEEVEQASKLARKIMANAPSVVPTVRKNRQVERAEGEWVRNFDGNEWYWYCTNCKTQWYEDDLYMGGNEFPNFCPNCGAKMKGDSE